MAANMLNVSRPHAARAVTELKRRGFIVNVRRGLKRGNQKVASEWRLTCLPFQGVPPTCDYQKVYDRAKRQEIAAAVKGERFFTPEMERRDRQSHDWYHNRPTYSDESE